ncbi:YqhA family protein [Phenylobacterium sp. LjRoot219]
MAPFYAILVAALGGLLYIFAAEAWHELSHLNTMSPERAILMVLSLIDLSLAGNLLVLVIFSGYENFVAKIEPLNSKDRPKWMGSVDFSGMKMKLAGSIVAISAIALLRTFMRLAEGETFSEHTLRWLIYLHLTFVISGVLLAVMAWIAMRTKD